jgi:hypothetical protein
MRSSIWILYESLFTWSWVLHEKPPADQLPTVSQHLEEPRGSFPCLWELCSDHCPPPDQSCFSKAFLVTSLNLNHPQILCMLSSSPLAPPIVSFLYGIVLTDCGEGYKLRSSSLSLLLFHPSLSNGCTISARTVKYTADSAVPSEMFQSVYRDTMSTLCKWVAEDCRDLSTADCKLVEQSFNFIIVSNSAVCCYSECYKWVY